ncbi:GNAT family N-acetyltransferase [Cyclobacterium amurskyense]|uniref:GCN5-related N-acetyltransferase n=1 Tax=Cyclobacterium amurskyense TaxID=320787 RepID=A0A0H4PDV9_9BACT|nr:GNAT family N-acetyltransferase [Cyclobacterium amurskyense]AKP50988.1 GCN5-related N-acetyltransferase [Cyclobacterium amurskyense]|tara:strand:- start:4354 stop:4827 length:474 start_codon:yes stop_codon:yes gene_type:complete
MYTVRKGKKEDLPAILDLIKELALYEKAPDEVTNTLEMMEKDGFGPEPVFGFFVVEKGEEKTIVGTAIYYYRYSTWKGKRLYLEDYIITEKERGKGAGKLLFERVLAKSLEDGCTGMMWQVLDWNEPAINFYKKYGASMEEEWINCNLQSEEIRALI